MNQNLLDKNLLSLSVASTEAASKISHCQESGHVVFEQSKDGNLIPVIISKSEKKALHSQFNPVREGQRLAAECQGKGTVLAYGLGAGYHLLPLLKSKDLTSLIIIDTDPGLIRSLMGHLDFTALFLDKRVTLWLSENACDFKNFFLSRYIPVLSGNLSSISLRSRIEGEKDFFHTAAAAVKESISMITDDYTVQTHFGKKWFINSLSNLQASENTTLILNPAKKIFICAAGPGLENQMDYLKKERSGATIIATDTSLPALLQNDILPDLVISIDCQHISYHHFMQGYPEDVPLVLDLASPPFLTRIGKKHFFFASDHPFSSYISKYFRQFPHIDTSGGNVTHAALSLADSLGATEIRLLGADFSYPCGKPYTRGSYIYPYYMKSGNRTNGIENQILNFVLHNKILSKEKTAGGFRYISKPMVHYKNSLEKKVSQMDAVVKNMRVDGIKLNLPEKSAGNKGKSTIMSAGRSCQSHSDFIKEYSERVCSLPEIKGSISEYLSLLTYDEKEILATLLPAAAQFRKKHETGQEALLHAQKWTVQILERSLVIR